MLKKIIEWCVKNKFFVILITLAVIAGGIYAIKEINIDAIPDLSDTQVIIYTKYPGQAPELVEQQVTYPITTAMMGVAKAKVVRGYSFFGVSMVYVIFKDGTDLYWARSRVLEYLNTIANKLPPNVKPTMGPDASGVGWVYEYALTSKKHDLSELRSLQDWYLRYSLESVPGVAEVASIGGYVRNYRVTVDPIKMRAYHITLKQVENAIKRSNNDEGGGTIEMGEMEFMVRGLGYLKTLDDFNKIPVGISKPTINATNADAMNSSTENSQENNSAFTASGTPIYLSQIATINIEPEARRGIVELNGKEKLLAESLLCVIKRMPLKP